MKVYLIREKRLAEYNDGYAARLIEQGKAALPAAPKRAPAKAAQAPAAPAEIPEKAAKRGKASGK